MKWLRQQTRVELLFAAATQNSVQLRRLRLQLHQQTMHRLQQPGTLAWAFAAGTLYGSTKNGNSDKRTQDDRAIPLLRYLNSIAAVWNLMSEFRPDH
jgi:hypothetical protein